MAAPDFSDISKPLDGRIGVPRVAAVMPLPAYGDLSKAANDVSCAIDPQQREPHGLTDMLLAYQQGLLPHPGWHVALHRPTARKSRLTAQPSQP
jgi:hypothetical protein